MADNEIAHVIAALSARINALEGAIHALAIGGSPNLERTLTAFDSYCQQMLDRYEGLPIDDYAIRLLEDSLRDVRELLARQST
jgi:hypothetical protein